MQPSVTIEAWGGGGWLEMVALRHHVLRAPLGLAFSREQLEAETGQIHLALWLEAELAGTLLLLPPDAQGEARLRQMAIRPHLERRGLGRLLVGHGEGELRRLGATGAWLSARETAIGFYAALGYVAEGAAFTEVTLPHRRMRKRLDPDAPPA